MTVNFWIYSVHLHVCTHSVRQCYSDCKLLYLLCSFACVYSQCASTTLSGTMSSERLTVRRAREAVGGSSSSHSSSLSRSAAVWPMATHRRHFLFHTSGDVTCKQTHEVTCFCNFMCFSIHWCGRILI